MARLAQHVDISVFSVPVFLKPEVFDASGNSHGVAAARPASRTLARPGAVFAKVASVCVAVAAIAATSIAAPNWQTLEPPEGAFSKLVITLPSASIVQSAEVRKGAARGANAPLDVALAPSAGGAVRYRKLQPGAQDLVARSSGDVFYIEAESASAQPQTGSSSGLAVASKESSGILYEIELPTVAHQAQIHLRRGVVRLSTVARFMLLTCKDCEVDVSGLEFGAELNVVNGSIDVKSAKGAVSISTQTAKVQVTDLKGSLNLTALSSVARLSQIDGAVSIAANSGSIDLKGVSGELKVDSARASISAIGVSGRIKGELQDGSFSVALASGSGTVDVNLKSQDANITIQPAAGAGYQLRLQSEEGSIVVPSPLKAPKGSGPKSFFGRIPGESKGLIAVRSQKGAIRIK